MSAIYKGRALGYTLLIFGGAATVNRFHRSKVNVPSTFTQQVSEFETTHVFRNDRYGDDQMFWDYSKDTAYWPRWDRRDEPDELVNQTEILERAAERGNWDNLDDKHKKLLNKLYQRSAQSHQTAEKL